MKNETKGLIFALLSPFFYSLRSLVIKLSPPTSPEVFSLYTTLFSFILFFPLFIKYRSKLIPKKFGLIFLRASLTVPAVLCSVYGFQHLALSDAILLENSLPFFILLIMLTMKRKRLSYQSFFAIALGFVGIFFVLKPKLDLWHLVIFAPLGAAFLGALICIMLSDLSKVNHSTTILFYTRLIGILLYATLSFIHFQGINPETWKFISLASLFVTGFQYSLVRSYALLPPHIVGGLIYFGILFSALWEWIIWGVYLDMWQILGGIIIVSTGLLVLKENQRLTEEISFKKQATN